MFLVLGVTSDRGAGCERDVDQRMNEGYRDRGCGALMRSVCALRRMRMAKWEYEESMKKYKKS